MLGLTSQLYAIKAFTLVAILLLFCCYFVAILLDFGVKVLKRLIIPVLFSGLLVSLMAASADLTSDVGLFDNEKVMICIAPPALYAGDTYNCLDRTISIVERECLTEGSCSDFSIRFYEKDAIDLSMIDFKNQLKDLYESKERNIREYIREVHGLSNEATTEILHEFFGSFYEKKSNDISNKTVSNISAYTGNYNTNKNKSITILSEHSYEITNAKASGSYHFVSTLDGGNNWEQYSVTGNLNKIQFLDDNIGFTNSGRNFYKTLNGGNSWAYVGSIDSFISIPKFTFVNENLGFALSDGTNGGQVAA